MGNSAQIEKLRKDHKEEVEKWERQQAKLLADRDRTDRLRMEKEDKVEAARLLMMQQKLKDDAEIRREELQRRDREQDRADAAAVQQQQLFLKMADDEKEREKTRQEEAAAMRAERESAQNRADAQIERLEEERKKADAQKQREMAALKEQQESMQKEQERIQGELTEKAAAAEAAAKEKQRILKETLGQQRETLSAHLKEKEAVYDEIHGRAECILSEIELEEKEIAEFQMERLDCSTKIIVTLGMTGGGKSTLCNRLNGDESEFGDEGTAQTSGNGTSCTQSNSRHHVEIEGHSVTVVDTPGLGDSFGRDRQHSVKLCEFLRGCGGINAFVLVRNGAQVRFDKHFQNMLRDYHTMFGELFFHRLIIVATRIEDRVLKQYVKYNQEAMLRGDICDMFDLEKLEIPVIPIGLDGYKESLISLVEAIPSDKHEFKEIKSPLDDLRTGHAAVLEEEKEMMQQIQAIQSEIAEIDVEIAKL